ncbi:hypothetical protein ACFLQN_03470 [Candidatus Aenigmatarchaeota archaeon]
MDSETREKVEKFRKDEWIEASFSVEALGIDKETVETALKEHIEKMKKIKSVFVYETEYKETIKVEKPFKNIDIAYSQVVELKLFMKDMYSLMTAIVLYGPSALEILSPEHKEIKLNEIQNIAVSLSSLVHQFAAAGAGGIVMTPEKKK